MVDDLCITDVLSYIKEKSASEKGFQWVNDYDIAEYFKGKYDKENVNDALRYLMQHPHIEMDINSLGGGVPASFCYAWREPPDETVKRFIGAVKSKAPEKDGTVALKYNPETGKYE